MTKGDSTSNANRISTSSASVVMFTAMWLRPDVHDAEVGFALSDRELFEVGVMREHDEPSSEGLSQDVPVRATAQTELRRGHDGASRSAQPIDDPLLDVLVGQEGALAEPHAGIFTSQIRSLRRACAA